MPGAFVHLELHTDDTHDAKAFYKELFGWDYNDVPMGDAVYTMVASSQVHPAKAKPEFFVKNSKPNWYQLLELIMWLTTFQKTTWAKQYKFA